MGNIRDQITDALYRLIQKRWISSKKKVKLAPGEMENVVIPADVLAAMDENSSITVRVEE